MKLLELYSMMQAGEVTKEQAAHALGTSVVGLKVREGKLGHKLPLVLSVLDKIADDKITRSEAADVLQTTVRNVNALMASWQISRPLKPYLIERAAPKVKWEIRKKYAIDFIADASTIEDAAEAAGVSTRQMRRWVAELMKKHFGATWGDLKDMTATKRRRLASEIETAENLEIARQQVIKRISDGDLTIEDDVLSRIVARRARKKENHVR